MFETIDQISGGAMTNWANRLFVDAALGYFTTFMLVTVRLSGLMIIGPFFGHTSIPERVKVLFALALALMITPSLPDIRDRGFDKLDLDKNGVLSGREVPTMFVVAAAGEDAEEAETPVVTRSEFRASAGVPSTLFDLLWVVATELAIGLILGLGVVILLTGLQMAGETFDQQTGTALSEIFNPAMGTTISPTGQLLFLLGTTALLVMPPFDGHLMMLMSLLKTFEVIPLGMAWIDGASLEVLRSLMSQSLALAVQIAAPLLAAMALLSVAMGFLGYTVPQVNVLVLGFPIRALVSMVILIVTLSGAADAIVEVFPDVLDALSYSLIASDG
ncbi:flagellar biosynthetic protein FliR [Rubinisphaera margarita]|uniref:flagellar biosynthetic protein FliR n=1 Tax=Rubinisphaera margarita TaxID=2909586 RepID=UPI001EE915B9|nr:flagellar biosynthetic protein FliR [Rubinisphaera margarita]MCG6154521.1 flagellar biosynthetic protein FliR [Rubinisphaera margarita]